MAMGTREELDRNELDGDGDEEGARRGGWVRTRVHMLLGAPLQSCPVAVGPGAGDSLIRAASSISPPLSRQPSLQPSRGSRRIYGMAETLDMSLDDIIKNSKKSNSSSGRGGRRWGRSGSSGGGDGGAGRPTRRPFKRSGNRQGPYQPPKVRMNRVG
jgi:hypothetical protein